MNFPRTSVRRLLCISVLVADLFGPVRGWAEDPNEALQSALSNLAKGHVLDAIRELKEITRASPDFDPAYYLLAKLYTQMNRLDAAEHYLNRALAVDPNQGIYYYQSGLIRLGQKKWREALALFQQSLKVGPAGGEALVWRDIGKTYEELFDFDKALDAYQRSRRFDDADPKTHLALASIYLDRNPEKAIPELRSAIALKPDLPGAFSSLGRAYRRVGNMASALEVLRKGVELNPADQDSRYGLAQALLAAGHRDEGRAEMQTYQRIRNQVELANSNYRAAEKKLEAGELAEAERLFTEAVKLAPTYGPALYGQGSILVDRGETEKAIAALERAAAINGLNPEIYFRLGAAYLQEHKLAEALEATKRAIIIDEEDVRYQRQLREINIQLDRLEKGQMAVEESGHQPPKDGGRR